MINKIIKTAAYIILVTVPVFSHAAEKTYIRDYTYQASDTDSKVSARNKTILFLKQNLLQEIGTYVGSDIHIMSVAHGSDGNTAAVQKIRSITEGFIKLEAIVEKWNGSSFYMKASMKADPEAIAARLKAVYSSQSTDNKANNETAYWQSVVQLDSKAAYTDYMTKYPLGKYIDLAKIAVERMDKKPVMQQYNSDWLLKKPGNITLVVRHDTGWFNDLDPAIITKEMAQTVQKIYQRFLPPETKFKVISNFEESQHYKFNHKEQSQIECNNSRSDIVAGALLNDYSSFEGKYRPVKLFIYDCKTMNFKLSSFVPKVNSPKEFWREAAIKKNLRVFIREYLDTM